MKKIILGICDNGSKRVNHNGGNTNNDVIKLMIIDTTKEGEEDYEFPVIPLKPNTYNRLSWEVLCDLLSPDNQKYLIVPGDEENLIEEELVQSNNKIAGTDLNPSRLILTQIQRAIMDLAVDEGLSTKEIADRLNKSYHTIKNHFSNIYERMGVNSLPGAINMYLDYRKRMN
jgi:DNA-binding CsgD family transcriptional regulator